MTDPTPTPRNVVNGFVKYLNACGGVTALDVDRFEAEYRAALAATGDAPLSADAVDEMRRVNELRLRHFQRMNAKADDGDASFAMAILACHAVDDALTILTETAAQIAAARAERDALREKVAGIASAMAVLAEQRCSDGFCELGGQAKGMHTNGGCHCLTDVRPFLLRKGLVKLLRECRALATPARPTDTGRDG